MRRILLACAMMLTPVLALHAQSPDARIGNWINAAGGPKVWDAIHELEYTITTVWYDPNGVELRRRPRYVSIQKLPGAFRVRVERTEADGHYVQVWDGAHAWATLDGVLLEDSAKAVREVQYVAGDLSYWIGLPWKLRDPGVNLTSAGDSVVAVSFGSGVGLHDGDRFWYFFGKASAFPLEVDYIEQGKTENDRQHVRFKEWQKIGPVVYAVNRTTVDARGRPVRALLISDVVANRRIDPARFQSPQPR